LVTLIVDPSTRSLTAYDTEHPDGITFGDSETFTNARLPALSLLLGEVFAVLDEPA
jgi:hypothetical protein